MMSVASTIIAKIQKDSSVDVTHLLRAYGADWLSVYECEEIYKLTRMPESAGTRCLFWDGSILFCTHPVGKGFQYHEYDVNPVLR